jgi:hypothetical protein
MFVNIIPIILIAAFALLNAGFLTYERYVSLPLDLEFSTFTTILMTMKFGLMWGLATAFFTKMAHILHNKDFNMNSVFSLLQYFLVAFATSVIMNFNLSLIPMGIMIVIISNIFGYLVLKYINMLSDYEVFMFGASNLLFNFVLLLGFTPFIVPLFF